MRALDHKLRPWYLGLAAVMVLLGLACQQVNPWLAFDRHAIEQGQWWRLISCHFVHLTPWHMLLNLSGFLLCGYFFEDLLSRARVAWWALAGGLIEGLALYLLDPNLQHYAGLSGILHSLLVMCLLLGWRGNPWLHSLVLAVIAGRIFFEQQPGYNVDYLQAWIHGKVYVNAHLYGAITGVILAGGVFLGQYGYRRAQR
ncbi:MAG: rhombosortase [Alcanivorax sp.]|nr:rhombosortase [Alcanivorax sp.]